MHYLSGVRHPEASSLNALASHDYGKPRGTRIPSVKDTPLEVIDAVVAYLTTTPAYLATTGRI